MASFLLRLTAGQFELADEADMRRLLAAIANKKFLMFRRYELAAKRDRRLTRPLSHDPASKTTWSPSDGLGMLRDIDDKLRQLLTDDEFQLFELRRQGASWNEIATQQQVDSAALRKRYSRALTRVAVQLGIDWDAGKL
jgi:DNA-directed RNA polymerase specialized sigma24 family protein